jgi:hypothetical protein
MATLRKYKSMLTFKSTGPDDLNIANSWTTSGTVDFSTDSRIYLKSNTKKCLGNTTDYLNALKFVEFYSEFFWYYNETLIESNENNIQKTEIFLIMDNSRKIMNSPKCLSIGLNEPFKVYSNPSPPHFIDDLRTKNKIETQDWTIKFNEQNKGQLIIGDLPHNYEKDTFKYSENNYTKCKELTTFKQLTSFIVNGYIYGYYTKEKAQIIYDLFETNQ